MKICVKCKKEKSLDEFNKNKARKDGRQTNCRVCQHSYHKEWYSDPEKHKEQRDRVKKARKTLTDLHREFILAYFKTHPCVDCGITDIRVLEFDHLPSFKKEANISEAIHQGWSIEKLKIEIEKCEVRCRNHHAIKTYERDGSWRHQAFLLDTV